jgi:signal transduction histidine kinase
LILTSFHVVPEQRRESGNWLQAKKEAEARAEELSAIFDASPGVTLIARDPECRVMTGGRVTYDVHQQPHGVNLSKSAPGAERPSNFRVFRNGREVPAHELPLQKAAASGKEIRNSELTIVFNDGKSRDFLGNAAPLLAPDGKVRGAVGVFIDITERKVAERSARELYAHMLKVQDVERRRIARELHDSVGQNLTGLLLSLRALKNISARLDKESRATLSEALTAAREATRDVRTLSRLLHPPLLQEFGLLVAIRTFARGFSEASGIKVDVDLPPRKRRLHKDVEATLFRVVQEALTNVYRHSGSKRATIHMRETGRDLVLEIRDSGRGIQMSSTHPKNPKTVGVGIAGIRERLQQFDGQLELQSSRNGTVLRALLPLSRAAG